MHLANKLVFAQDNPLKNLSYLQVKTIAYLARGVLYTPMGSVPYRQILDLAQRATCQILSCIYIGELSMIMPVIMPVIATCDSHHCT